MYVPQSSVNLGALGSEAVPGYYVGSHFWLVEPITTNVQRKGWILSSIVIIPYSLFFLTFV
jgi:hypothetical protein